MPSKKEETPKKVTRQGTYAPVKLHVDAVNLGHRRSKRYVYHSSSLVQIQGVQQRSDAQWYFRKESYINTELLIQETINQETEESGEKSFLLTETLESFDVDLAPTYLLPPPENTLKFSCFQVTFK